MFAFQAKDLVGPAEMAGGDFDARTVGGAGGTSLVARTILEQRLRRGAAPLISRTDKEELGFQRD